MAYPNAGGGYAMALPPEGAPAQVTEAWALSESGRRMALAAREGDAEVMRDAIRLNWRLWTVFQAQLATGGSLDVPEDIRINLLTLCQFIDKHTFDAILEPSPKKLQILIDINRNIAAGLQDSAKHSAAEAAEQQAAESAPPPEQRMAVNEVG